MEYSINKLAQLAGVSTRTLRFYDQCGLLVPRRISNGYRIYGATEVDRLQQILFYRELGVELADIKRLLEEEGFDNVAALQAHLAALQNRRSQLDMLISTVEKTINAQLGEVEMKDSEKFSGFKQQLIVDNEAKYGEEIRSKYGSDTIDRANAKLREMSAGQYAAAEQLAQDYQATLKEAFALGDPASELAQRACDLHKQWLCCYWDSYSKQAHLGVTELYVEDARFTAYYDKIAPGCAEFLRDAVRVFCGEQG